MRIQIKRNMTSWYVCYLAIIMTIAFKDMTALCRATQILLYVVLLPKLLMQIKRVQKPYIIWGGLFLFYSALSAFWAVSAVTVVNRVISIIQIVLFGSCLVLMIDNRRDAFRVLNSYLVGVFVLTIRTLLMVPVSAWGTDRMAFSGYHVNGIANMLSYSVLIIFCLTFYTAKRKKLLLTAVMLIEMFVIAMSAAKKNLIIVPLMMVVIFVLHQKNPIKIIKNLLWLMILVAGAYWFVNENIDIFGYSIARLTGFMDYFNGSRNQMDASTAERLYLMQTALKVYKENPIFGCGLHNYQFYNTKGLYAHSNYLEIAASLGTVGLLIYYSLHIVMGEKLLKYRKGFDKSIWFIAATLLSGMLILDVMQVTYYNEYIHILLALISAMCTIEMKGKNNID